MKVIKLAVIFVFAALFTGANLFLHEQTVDASAFGPASSFTGAPGEGNCTACHTTYAVNSGTGGIAVTGIPLNYKPGQQIPVTITTSQADGVNFGFQITAIDNQGRRAGEFEPQNSQTQNTFGNVGGNTREYGEHTIDGIIPTQFGSKTWTMIWTAPAQRIGKIDFYAAGNAANGDGRTGEDYIYTTAKSTLSGSAISNFNGDTKSEIAVFRPGTGIWYSYNLDNGAVISDQFGAPGDRIVPGDYDGDGKTDFAVFRASTGDWYLSKSSQGVSVIHFGATGDIPAQGDFDGDGKTDLAVFRPSTGLWFLNQSTAGQAVFQFGSSGDKPVPGDYDADAKSDIAVFRPANGIWFVMKSTGGTAATQFGASGDRAVQADYDGDGRTDMAVYRPSAGAWFRLKSGGGSDVTVFGVSSDIPVPADYDGDGKADIGLFRPAGGLWFLINSSNGANSVWFFGSNGDVPVPAAYNPE